MDRVGRGPIDSGAPPLSFRPQFSGSCSRSDPLSCPSSSSTPTRRLQHVDPMRNITRPEEDTTHHREKAHQRTTPRRIFDSPLDEAQSFIEHCQRFRCPSSQHLIPDSWEDYNPERPLRLKMPMKDWARLSGKLREGEVYPCLSYNASISTLIIQCMPSPLHESISSIFARRIGSVTDALPRDTRQMIHMKLNQDYNKFGNGWENSQKRPDLAIEIKNAAGEHEVKWVLEIGFNETYDQLLEDVRLWLEGLPDVEIVVIVKIIEDPAYQCPISPDSDLVQLGIPSNPLEILPRDVLLQGHFGPAVYMGHQWVGRISQVFTETWVRGDNGKARRSGNRRDLLPPANTQLRIPLQRFLDLEGYNGTVSFDLEDFRDLLSTSIQQLAADRCRQMLRKRVE